MERMAASNAADPRAQQHPAPELRECDRDDDIEHH